jgi:threonine synthase
MFSDPHTGVALAVLEKLVARGDIEPGQRTVVISTANGLKFTDFKVLYHERRLEEYGIDSQYTNRPLELPPDLDQVKRAVFGSLERDAPVRRVPQTAR